MTLALELFIHACWGVMCLLYVSILMHACMRAHDVCQQFRAHVHIHVAELVGGCMEGA